MIENSLNSESKKKSTYYAESQKRYGEKCTKFAVKYTPNENEVSEVVTSAIKNSGLTANTWIKIAIKEKLERDGLLPAIEECEK